MIAVLVRLKVRLLRNQLGRGGQQIAGLVVLLVLTLAGAGTAALVIATGRASPALFADLCIVAAAVLTAGWLLVPIAASGVDSTLDIGRLSLLPIRGRVHGPGLLAAALVGVGPLATLVLLCGFASHGRGVPGAMVVLAAMVVQTVQVALVGRTAVAALGTLLLRRRTRELAFSLGALLTAFGGFGLQLAAGSASGVSAAGLDRAAAVLRWNPFGLAARAAAMAIEGGVPRAGRPGGTGWGWLPAALVLLVAALAMAAVTARLWWALVARELTTAAAPGGGRARRRARLGGHTPRQAVTRRELRYLWRHPVARTNTITSFVLSGMYLIPQRHELDQPGRVLLAAALVGTVGLSALNMLAIDGRAAASDALCAPIEVVLAGKAMARLVLGLAVVAATALFLASLSGACADVPIAVLLACGGVGPILGVGAFASVAAPVPVPDVAGGNPWSTAPGQGCVTALAAFGLFAVAGVLAAPVVLAAVVARVVLDSDVALIGVALAAPVYGWLAWRVGLAAARRRSRSRLPELLTALAPK